MSRSSAAFTLLEVVCALAIVAIGMTFFLRLQSGVIGKEVSEWFAQQRLLKLTGLIERAISEKKSIALQDASLAADFSVTFKNVGDIPGLAKYARALTLVKGRAQMRGGEVLQMITCIPYAEVKER